MQSAIRRRIICIVSGTAFWLCTPPPSIERDNLPSIFGTLHSDGALKQATAFGTVRIALNGEVHTGSIETVLKGAHTFRSDIYSPLGGVIASFRADSLNGTFVFQEQERTFALTRLMDSLPFTRGGVFSFGELSWILLGRVPPAYMGRLRTPPDTIEREKRTISAVWKTDSTVLKAVIRKNPACLKEVTIGSAAEGKEAWRLSLGAFKKGFAHKIGLFESDANYFLIEYQKVKGD